MSWTEIGQLPGVPGPAGPAGPPGPAGPGGVVYEPDQTHTWTADEIAEAASWWGANCVYIFQWTPTISGDLVFVLPTQNEDEDHWNFDYYLFRGDQPNVDYPARTAGDFDIEARPYLNVYPSSFPGPSQFKMDSAYVEAGQPYTVCIADWSGVPGHTTNLDGILVSLYPFGGIENPPPPPPAGVDCIVVQHPNGELAARPIHHELGVGPQSRSSGWGNFASGRYSSAHGSGNNASGPISHATGFATTAAGQHAHSEGSSTTAQGDYSHAEGQSSVALGSASHSEGLGSLAEGDQSHAEGNGAQATGAASHAEGQNSVASGVNSHAEGQNTTASGMNAHAEGRGSTASGQGAHAEGASTASGELSHAGGDSCVASGLASRAGGLAATAWRRGEEALGGGAFSEAAAAQVSRLVLYAGVGGPLWNGDVQYVPLTDNRLSLLRIEVATWSTDGTRAASWTVRATVAKMGGTPRLVGNPVITQVGADATASGWNCQLTIEDKGGSDQLVLACWASGHAVAVVEIVEVP